MVSLHSQGQNHEQDHVECDPSPEQIRERALAIRRMWSDRTRHRRRAEPDAKWLVPLVLISDITAAANNN